MYIAGMRAKSSASVSARQEFSPAISQTVCLIPSSAVKSQRGSRAQASATSSSIALSSRYVRNAGPVWAPSVLMWHVLSSSLSLRVFSCFFIAPETYSFVSKRATMPVCEWEPIVWR